MMIGITMVPNSAKIASGGNPLPCMVIVDLDQQTARAPLPMLSPLPTAAPRRNHNAASIQSPSK